MAESSGIAPKNLEASERWHYFDTAPEEAGQTLDQCHIVPSLVFVVMVVKLFEPGMIAGNNCDRLQNMEIVNGSVEENVYAEAEVAVLERLSSDVY